ncbi:predicted protein [Lichtheimia corymbifera JMRC:FSU:9682]|uniref:Uncharacterized protein n=2 Tax=Lichtheimia TaxID=688353 RepID=A0A068RTZ6_9FUNG|nr:uncharacterized protein O0I10_002906 [Lichtheimia ornata]KAJ8661159.1 hypothetical protein O0I10_002906 [Lichtheimia ornata]CDH53648.1 predicted protein [Lichtheimia corymbifera JMRC:FSU:9682]
MADDNYITEDAEAREALVNNVLQLQQQLRAVISRVDSAKKEHESLLTENQMLQKYINNSLTSTAVFGATGGAISQSAAAMMSKTAYDNNH